MKAIILAAGRGRRMGGLTESKPKCLVEFRQKPLFDWQIEGLRKAGIKDIAVVTGYRRNLLQRPGLREFHNLRWKETNMVSSLAGADEWLNTTDCIVSYSDIFYDYSAVEILMGSNDSLAVTYDPNWLEQWQRRFDNPLDDAETFRLNSDNTLAEIGKKPPSIESVQGQYMGLLRITPQGWSEISRIRMEMSEAARDKIHMTGTLQKIIAAGNVPVKALPYTGEWAEFDSEEDLIRCALAK